MRCSAAGYCALVLFALVAPASGQRAESPAGSLAGKIITTAGSLSSDATIVREAQEALDRVSTPDGPGAAVLIARGTRSFTGMHLVALRLSLVFRSRQTTCSALPL
jgi:hypothetical protein